MTMASGEKPAVVVGGGLLGVATFYELLRSGRPAVLLETGEQLATGASFANGGMLTASMPDPWNSPGVGKHLIASLFDPYAAMKLRPHVFPGMMFWGLKFLRNSTPARHRQTTQENYRLARYSVERTAALTDELGIEYDASSAGTLKVFDSDKAFEASRSISEILVPLGLEFATLSAEEAVNKEPALINVKDRIVQALFYPGDASGDAHLFTRALANCCKAMGGEVRTHSEVQRIEVERGRVVALQTKQGRVEADDIVLAAGAQSFGLAKTAGVSLPIRPAKGYSVSVDIEGWELTPTIPIIDDAMHAAVTPLGDRLRFVGTAEFAGFDTRIQPDRIDNLFNLLSRLYPHLVDRIDRGRARTWAGLRPMSADGRALIGGIGPKGLWVNTGHGHLGWTMAVGSAEMLAADMLGRKPPVGTTAFMAER